MKLLLTTSRKTSLRVRQFIKEFSYLFPKSYIQRSNRGKASLNELFQQSLAKYDRIILVTNKQGNPNRIIGYYKHQDDFLWCFEFKIRSVKLSYELKVEQSSNPDKTVFSFKNFNTDLEQVLTSFFEPFIEKDFVNENLPVLNLIFEHKEVGFEIYPQSQVEHSLSPEILIDEIIIKDPEKSGDF